MKIISITGGVGSGKSEVLRVLQEEFDANPIRFTNKKTIENRRYKRLSFFRYSQRPKAIGTGTQHK